VATTVATCVWQISDVLIRALDERFGDPLDAFVNGSQTWLLDNGPNGMTLEWRLHPVPGYQRPASLGTYAVFPAIAAALFERRDPPAAPATLWDGLEAFAAHGDEVEPAPLRAAAVEALGLEPDACGLVDHESIADRWETTRGRSSIIADLLTQLGSR
jgi:hypothetical protein